MACRLFFTEPLSEPMLFSYCQLDLTNKIQNFNQNTLFSFTNMQLQISFAKWQPFCPGEFSQYCCNQHMLQYVWRLYHISGICGTIALPEWTVIPMMKGNRCMMGKPGWCMMHWTMTSLVRCAISHGEPTESSLPSSQDMQSGLDWGNTKCANVYHFVIFHSGWAKQIQICKDKISDIW